MAVTIESLLEQLEQATELADLHSTVFALRDYFGVAHIVYHWVSPDGEQYGCGTYDPAWVQHYVDKEYLRVDPVVIGCFQRFHPVDWKMLDWSSKQARTFQKDAIEHGVGNQGYSVPIRGPNGQFALFSVSHNCTDEAWEAFTETHRRELILIAHTLNDKALSFEKDRAPETSKNLSPREIDALTFIAMGYARAQVADMLSISEHTLRVYIESARHKLHAQNTTHAVAKAMNEGLIVVGGAARAAEGGWPGRAESHDQAPKIA